MAELSGEAMVDPANNHMLVSKIKKCNTFLKFSTFKKFATSPSTFLKFSTLNILPCPPARFSNFNLKIFATSPGKTISSLKNIIEMFARLSTSFFFGKGGGGGGGGGCGLLLGLGLRLGFRFCV